MVSRLHYITQEHPSMSHQQLALEAMQGGVKWIQVRVKNKPEDEVKEIALGISKAAKHFGAKVILNDFVQIALELELDGVHIGKQDMDAVTARKILGEKFIIGGTANTWEDIDRLHRAGVNYIGLGPYRFTATKDQLSPVLGLAGYQNILSSCKNHGIHTPIIAIGGIRLTDVESLINVGLYGVAVAAAINFDEHPSMAAARFIKEINSDLILSY